MKNGWEETEPTTFVKALYFLYFPLGLPTRLFVVDFEYPRIGASLLREYIILFRILSKLVEPNDNRYIVLISRFIRSIEPFETL